MRSQYSLIPFLLHLALYFFIGCFLVPIVGFLVGQTKPGSTIVFVSDENTDQSKIFLMDTEQGIIKKFSNYPQVICCPIWSPDGQQIAYVSTSSDGRQILVINIYS